jgi:hypothetical protein
LHFSSPLDQPWLLGGQLRVDRIDVLQEGHDGVQLLVGEVELGMLRRPGMPSFGRLWMNALTPSSP